ncbi:hypothetical protein BO996_10720 [Delftia sp. HK171]|jgi:hypothetical protein|uniref:hypothetical protein n=1 Tax=Delftia sp. HK171 TaxID=1920191 RepID=UPI0009041E75|nr:hypothetical protein [Delftia sp. HK171]APE48291.1 hypothetical protein BO996_10720 [Delftia sp. HK171]
MDASQVKKALEEVLKFIQKTSGLDCPPLTGKTKPIEEIPEFDSKIWPIATGLLADKLGITIPNDVNIFAKKGTDEALTIDETVAAVLKLIKKQAVSTPKIAGAR